MARRQHSLGEVSVILTRKDGKETNTLDGLKLSDIEAKIEPAAVAAIDQDFDSLFRGVADENLKKGIRNEKLKNVILRNIVLGTDEIIVNHGFGYAPHFYNVIPKSNVVWYESREPDTSNVYLIAAAAVTVDVIIQG